MNNSDHNCVVRMFVDRPFVRAVPATKVKESAQAMSESLCGSVTQGHSRQYGWSGFNRGTFKKNLATMTILLCTHGTCSRPPFLLTLMIDMKMAANSLKQSLPSLSDEPHHPKNFEFPKRTFGKSNLCCAPCRASGLIASWPFLQYNEQEALSESACDVSL